LLGPQLRTIKFLKQKYFSVSKKAYADFFSSIPCQITEIFGKKLGFWALALLATCGRKKNFETTLYAKIAEKKIQPVLFSQSRDNWGQIL
jgi:hypothetical protein